MVVCLCRPIALSPFECAQLYTYTPIRQQLRGIKSVAKQQDFITARLLKNVNKYGRKGSLVPVKAGKMRNEWYPRRIANYVTSAELKSLTLQGVIVTRDPEFRIVNIPRKARVMEPNELPDAKSTSAVSSSTSVVSSAPAQSPVREPADIKVPTKLLSPERSAELLSVFANGSIEFNREPVNPADEAKGKMMTALESEKKNLSGPATRTPIYGSVTTADVVFMIKNILSVNEEASLVQFDASDTSIIEDGVKTDRVKHLGKYDVHIRIKGRENDAPILKKIKIIAST